MVSSKYAPLAPARHPKGSVDSCAPLEPLTLCGCCSNGQVEDARIRSLKEQILVVVSGWSASARYRKDELIHLVVAVRERARSALAAVEADLHIADVCVLWNSGRNEPKEHSREPLHHELIAGQ